MDQLRCDICGVNFKEKRCYRAHLKSKKHKNHIDNNIKDTYKCACGKSYMYRQSLYVHKKTCSYKQEPFTQVQVLMKENNEMREIIYKKDQEMREILDKKDKEMDEFRKQGSKEMDELRKQVEMLIETRNTTNNSNNTNHIQTQNNIENQYIVVNSFGNENIEHLTEQIICQLIKTSPFTCVPQLIEKIHFDPEHPENHNIKITNKKMNYAEIVKNNKWVTANKKKVIDDVIQKSYIILDETYTDNKDSISERRQERFDNFQNKFENKDETLHRNIKNDVDLLVINGTNELHK
uniref:C2H2-type domain-containing protein n=1 Tax=viral metagenome TaxID=1070528 RepID=A0A6C0CLU0_9ZZZZ